MAKKAAPKKAPKKTIKKVASKKAAKKTTPKLNPEEKAASSKYGFIKESIHAIQVSDSIKKKLRKVAKQGTGAVGKVHIMVLVEDLEGHKNKEIQEIYKLASDAGLYMLLIDSSEY